MADDMIPTSPALDHGAAFRRVLVPLDGSPEAEMVLPAVLQLARPLGLEIVLLRVVPSLTAVVAEGVRRDVVQNVERIRQQAEDSLCQIADRWCAEGFRFTTSVRTGDAAAEIVAGARESAVDLIAMATHGRSALGRLFFGSVAEAVLHVADVPVFLVRRSAATAGQRAA